VRIKHFIFCLVGAWFSLVGGCASTTAQRDVFATGFEDGSYPVYEGGQYGVGGQGAAHLDPWLSGTQPGQRLILGFFDHNYNGRIGPDRAGEANRWFRRFADRNHDLRVTDNEIHRALIALDGKLRQRGY
jgi:hypothetical protein